MSGNGNVPKPYGKLTDNQLPSVTDLKSLPKFLRDPAPQVRFHSAFPPFSTEKRVRSVMERAGFDVYKPPEIPKSGSSSPKSGSQRNFTAPTTMNSRATHSDPALAKNKRSVSNTSLTIDSKLNRLQSGSPLNQSPSARPPKSTYNAFSSPNLSNLNSNASSPSLNKSITSNDSQQPLSMKTRIANRFHTPLLNATQQSPKEVTRSNGKSYGTLGESSTRSSATSIPSLRENFITGANKSVNNEKESSKPPAPPPHRESTDFQFFPDKQPSSIANNNITFSYSPEQMSEKDKERLYGSTRPDSTPIDKVTNPMADEEEEVDAVVSKGRSVAESNNNNLLSPNPAYTARQSSGFSEYTDANESISSFDAKFENNTEENKNNLDSSPNGSRQTSEVDPALFVTPPTDRSSEVQFQNNDYIKSPEEIFDEHKQEVEDSLQQLLSMKKELSPTPLQANFAPPQINIIKSSDSNGNGNDNGVRDSTSSSIYGSPAQGTRLSTMHTDDYKIYNTPTSFTNASNPPKGSPGNITGNKYDMSTIHEVTEVDYEPETTAASIDEAGDNESDANSSFLLEGLTKMRLNPLQSAHDSTRHQRNLSSESNSALQRKKSKRLSSSSFMSNQDIAQSLEPLEAQPPLGETIASKETSPIVKNTSKEVKHKPGEGPCRKCTLPITRNQKSIWSKDSELSGQWHRKCFTCHTCDKAFTKGESCYVFEDKPFCHQHFHELNGSLCAVCGNGVEGECLENEIEEIFHVHCLNCAVCHKLIKEDYYLYQNKVLCENDANIQLQKLQGDVDDKVTRRRTRIMYL